MENILKPDIIWKYTLDYGNCPQMIVLHHSKISQCSVYDIHEKQFENGGIGLGYHYFISKEGIIYAGRPENTIGAHCSGLNESSLGICAEGNYMHDFMGEKQKQAIIALGRYLINKYGISKILPHRDLSNTSCPGINFPFNEIRNEILKPTAPYPSIIAFHVDNNIYLLQLDLNSLFKANLITDGIFGPATKAIKQKAIAVFGTIDLSSAFREVKSRPSCSLGCIYTYTIKWLQYTFGTNITGIYDEDLLNAIIKYQKTKGIKADGVVGPLTWGKIFE